MKINVYRTHIEILPYTKGDNFELEKSHSIYDYITHSYIPTTYYYDTPILYLPRGENLNVLENEFKRSELSIINTSDPISYFNQVDLLYDPRDDLQKVAVDFLTCQGNYTGASRYNQYTLNMETDAGKTYCMINAICKFHMKSIIFTHISAVKDQWIDGFHKFTTFEKERIINIDSSEKLEAIYRGEIVGDIYITQHRTIMAYASTHGWISVRELFIRMEVGIKVFDEAHKFFNNILMLDFFTNTKKTYYITATFEKSDYRQQILFKKAFSNVLQFDGSDVGEKRKHTIYIPVTFQSYPSDSDRIRMCKSQYKFSIFEYTDYSVMRDKTIIKVLLEWIKKVQNLRGKILVTVAKKEACELISMVINEDKEINKHADYIHSSRKKAEVDEARNADIIIATIAGLGTGINIDGLRVVINLEPFTSKPNCKQLKGRLREFSPEDDTFLIELVDMGVPEVYDMYTKRERYYKKLVKEIRKYQM